MSNCKDCVFCKRDPLSDYIKETEFYKCDMDNDIILDPVHEGRYCTWYKEKKAQRENVIKKIKRWIRCRRKGGEG